MNKIFFKGLSHQNKSNGFTLVELMVAILITSIVVSITGWGVVAITQKNKEQKAETERRVELNRALDFIADEVRQAKPIATNASANLSITPTQVGVAPNFSSSGKTPVLTLQIPGVSQRVIYYIAPKETGSVWLGPNIVYRWGPNFNADGTYSNPTDPANWTYQPLADLIVNTTPSSTPSCPAGTLNPSSGITGFYACVDPSGRIADIHLRGELKDAYGNFRNSPLEVSSKVFARPYNSPFSLGVGRSSSAGNGGTITITQPSTTYFEVLGGDVACTATSPSIPTKTKIYYTYSGGTTQSQILNSTTKAWNLSAPIGTTITVSGILEAVAINNFCGITGDYNSATDNGTQVLTLRDGDSIPNFPPFGTGRTIDSYLTKYLDPVTKKVKLAENQVIFLYELVATDSSRSYYDLQDLVVLATIAPTNS